MYYGGGMSDTIDIRKYRSKFWCRVIPDQDRFELITSRRYSEVIDIVIEKHRMHRLSEWSLTSKRNYKISIKNKSINNDPAHNAFHEANKFIWLELNKNIDKYFDSELLDCCIAYDWGFSFENAKRTEIGEAEYKIKYCKCSDDEKTKYIQVLKNALEECYNYIPVKNKENLLITTIPISRNEKKANKLSWKMAKYISNTIYTKLLDLSISADKPKVKSLTTSKKVEMWEDLYSKFIDLESGVNGKEIIIVDDLYQSGVSMWMLAKFLKDNGASRVSGLVAVKAQRDSDNKHE